MLFWVFLAFLCTEFSVSVESVNDPKFELPHRGCYFTNWSQYRKGKAKFAVADVDPDLCTYIVVAFAKIENDTLQPLEWNDEETFRHLVGLRRNRTELRILLSVGGWTLSNQLVAVSSSAESRKTFVESVILKLRQWELDGLDVDWEYPDASQKGQYSQLLLDLREAFEKEAKVSRRQRLALAAAVHFTSDGGYDGRILNQALDFLNVMTYDLHGAWIPDKVGHHAPLFKGPFGSESTQSVATTMKAWEHLGVPKNKLILGLPLYGRGWNLSNPTDHGLGAPAKGAIRTSKWTSEAGAWPYYEICEKFKSDNASYVFDKDIQAAYAFTKDYWIGFDDRLTIAAKTKWAKTNGYGGVYIWDLAQDDFQNSCGLGKNPLLHAIRDIIKGNQNPNSAIALDHRPSTPTTPAWKPVTALRTTRITPASTSPRPPITAAAVPKPTNQPRRLAPSDLVTKPRVTFPVFIGNGPNGHHLHPKPSFGKQQCDKNFCLWSGPGSFAVGRCESKYCDCDAGNNPYSRECIGGLVYDTVNKYCNWQETVEGCTRFSGELTEALFENKFFGQ